MNDTVANDAGHLRSHLTTLLRTEQISTERYRELNDEIDRLVAEIEGEYP